MNIIMIVITIIRTHCVVLLQIQTSGQMSMLRLSNLSSLDHNSKISCTAENIVGEKESALLLDILCTFSLKYNYIIIQLQYNSITYFCIEPGTKSHTH